MMTRSSPSNRPWLWLLGETAVIAFFALAAWVVLAMGITAVSQLILFTGLVGIIVVLALRTVAEILVAGFCRWAKAMGGGLGSLVVSIRQA